MSGLSERNPESDHARSAASAIVTDKLTVKLDRPQLSAADRKRLQEAMEKGGGEPIEPEMARASRR